MKTELAAILTLAAALACAGGRAQTACGPGGCWMLPPDFDKAAEVLREREAARFESGRPDDARTVPPGR